MPDEPTAKTPTSYEITCAMQRAMDGVQEPGDAAMLAGFIADMFVHNAERALEVGRLNTALDEKAAKIEELADFGLKYLRRAEQAEAAIAQLPEIARQAIADHSLFVDEDTPDERVIAPSLLWFVEDYLPNKLASPVQGGAGVGPTQAVTPKTCAHCGRPCGDYDGGWASADGKPVCHPNEADRPDCYRLLTVYGATMGSLLQGADPDDLDAFISHQRETDPVFRAAWDAKQGAIPVILGDTIEVLLYNHHAELLKPVGEQDPDIADLATVYQNLTGWDALEEIAHDEAHAKLSAAFKDAATWTEEAT